MKEADFVNVSQDRVLTAYEGAGLGQFGPAWRIGGN